MELESTAVAVAAAVADLVWYILRVWGFKQAWWSIHRLKSVTYESHQGLISCVCWCFVYKILVMFGLFVFKWVDLSMLRSWIKGWIEGVEMATDCTFQSQRRIPSLHMKLWPRIFSWKIQLPLFPEERAWMGRSSNVGWYLQYETV